MPNDGSSANVEARPDDGLPRDCNAQMRDHLVEARKLLCLANRKGVRIPTDILADVIETERACEAHSVIDLDLETRFWDAYGILRRTIEPATKARRFYRIWFYSALAPMLLVQGYYLVGSHMHERFVSLQGMDPTSLAPAGQVAIAAQQAMYNDFAPGFLFFLPWLSGDIAVALLKTILEIVAAYLLPTLYGLLGACAFVLRQLSHDISTLQFADDSRVRYTLRLNIGMLAGLAVGWFIDPTQQGSVVANLSPLALAFVAGYGSDLLFAVLDRIVNAFTAPPPEPARDRPPVRSEPVSEGHLDPAPADSNGPPRASRRGPRSGTNGTQPQPEPAPAA
jgi:hypothetical protein